MNEENEEFEREMNYKPPSQVAMEEQAREFADGQEEDKDGWVTVRSPETAKYITVLDFEIGRVFQYKVKDRFIDNGDYEEYLTNKGHRLNNCEWMVHAVATIIKNTAWNAKL